MTGLDGVMDGLATVVALHADWVAAQITKGDYGVLDLGYELSGVMIPGNVPDSTPDAGSQIIFIEWTVIFEFFFNLSNVPADFENFGSARDGLFDHIYKYPTLNGTTGITKIRITAPNDPVEVFDENENGPFFLMQQLRVGVVEKVDLTGGEYA